MIGNDGLKLRCQVRQALGQWLGSIGFELPVGKVRETIALGADDAPAGRSKARIEAED